MDKCDLWNIQLRKAHEPTLIVAVKLKTWVPLTDLYQSLPWGPGGHLLLQWMVSFHMEAIRLQSQWPLTWKQFNTFEWSKNRPLLENYVNERAFKLIFFDTFLFFSLCWARHNMKLVLFLNPIPLKAVYAVFTISITPCFNLSFLPVLLHSEPLYFLPQLI